MFRSDLFDYSPIPDPIEPVRPRVLTVEQWRKQGGPDYRGIYAWRIETLNAIRSSPINERTGKPVLLDGILEYYRTRPLEFIVDWCDTFDPRRKRDKWIPFVLFQRQAEFISFLNECFTDEQNGLIEKCRDMGLTWLCVCWSVWAWLFIPSVSIGWGSRKQELVDRLGDPDSIFEKIRLLIGRLPPEFIPVGYVATHMKLINPNGGGSITGEIGDNIGRGGRKTIYFKDESAHYEHPELIEASLGDNTNIQIDISSVNGLGNVFHRRREEGEDWFPGCQIKPGTTRVFVVDWRDHPEKTQEWYDRRKSRATAEGLYAKFAQEVERNYSASLEGVIIPLEWIIAAEDAHVKLAHWRDERGKPYDWLAGGWSAGLDVADSEEGDRNACVAVKGVVLVDAEEWGERDIGATTRRAIVKLRGLAKNIVCQYDSVGMGSSVRSEYNRLLIDDKVIKANEVAFVPWNAGGQVRDPNFHLIENDDDSPLNGDMFGNMKAQAWWSVKMRFFYTWQAVTQGIRHPIEKLISLDTNILLIRKIEKELAQPVMTHNTRLQQIVDKKPEGTKSPNIADAIVMALYPLDPNEGAMIVGHHGTG